MKNFRYTLAVGLFACGFALAEEPLPAPLETLPVAPTPNPPQTTQHPKPDFNLPPVQSQGSSGTQGEVVNAPVKQETIPAGQPSPIETATGTFSRTKAQDFSTIFKEFLRRGFNDGQGHTVAASQLAACLPGLTPEQKVEEMMTIIYALSTSRHEVIHQRIVAGIANDSAITSLATHLACKKGNRTAAQMVSKLEIAYSEFLNERWVQWNSFHNVVVVANLLD